MSEIEYVSVEIEYARADISFALEEMGKRWLAKNFITTFVIMNWEKLKYQIALTLIPGIGDVLAKNLVAYCGSAEAVFKTPKWKLAKIPGIDTVRASAIAGFKDFKRVEKEIGFIEKNKIEPLFFTDEKYPKRLKNCSDAPILLYFKGDTDLNAEKIIAVVGTRKATDYGKEICEELIAGLASHNVLVVSGLAYGIDIAAHKAALSQKLNTVAVLGHGLDIIYPQQHKSIANKMIAQGGLLTEFVSHSEFIKENFPKRNRIVAGMSDAVVVIETAVKGGAMITAKTAYDYNRDVFAIPGKVKDLYSQGCHHLIKNNIAALAESAEDIVKVMGWEENLGKPKKQKELFIELNEQEKKIVSLFSNGEEIEIDNLLFNAKMNNSVAVNTLLNLELKGVIKSLPGKRYKMMN